MDSNMYTQWVQSPIQDSPSHESQDWPNSKDRPPTTNPSSTPIDMSEFTTLSDLAVPTSSSLLSPTTTQPFYPTYGSYYLPQSSPFTMAYGTPWPNTVPLSNYSSLNGATTSSSSQPPQHQSPQQQHPTPHVQQQLQLSPIPSSSQHMIIDPALTMNGPPSASMSSSFSHSPPFSPPPPQQQTQQQQQQVQAQSQAQQQQQRTQFFNQHILYPSPYYRQQPQPAPQGTLSPQALHSPTSSMVALIPSQYYQPQSLVQAGPSQQPSQPQQQQQQQRQSPSIPGPIASTSQIALAPIPHAQDQPQPAAEERKRQFENTIRPLLQPTAFTGAQAVNSLTSLIVEYGPGDVDASMRLEILARIRDGAGNHYYRAWSENPTAMDITREWIKASAKTNNAALVETTMPLLHLIDRLPITLESLRASKLGKIIKKLVKDEPSPAIKDMAYNLEQRWRTLLQSDTDGGGGTGTKASENKGNNEDSNSKVKKRKLAEASSVPAKMAQPTKKAAVGGGSATKPIAVKKEANSKPVLMSSSSSSSTTSSTTSSALQVKDAKADSSFFSAPKPKAKLPSFKKAPASAAQAMKKEEPPMPMNVALPSSTDPFQELLLSMQAQKRDSPAVSTPPSVSVTNSNQSNSESQPGLARNGRKKKVVTWAPEDQLESIKLIERAVYDDDPVDGTHVAHSFRDLDRGEGAALHAPQVFEEMADWAEPMLLELPPEMPEQNKTRGKDSEEKNTQAEREQTALSAMYLPNQIPDSPSEPEPTTVMLNEEEVDKDVTQMTAGPEVDAIFWSSDPVLVPGAGAGAGEGMAGVVATGAAGGAGATPSVADLVGQLAMGMDTSMMAAPPNMGQDAMAAVQQNLQSLPPEQLQQLLHQLQFGAMAAYGGAAASASASATSGGVSGGGTEGQWPPSAATPNQYGTEYGGNGYHEDNQAEMQPSRWSTDSGRGRGGRGRGRGRGGGRGDEGSGGGGFRTYIKRKPCSFFAAGRCKYGDQCDFAHDLSLLQQEH